MAFAAVQRISKGQASGATLVIGAGDGWATPTAGNLLVATANADATVTMTTAGFTAGPSVVDGNAAYVWWKIAAGTESSITFTPGVSAPIAGTVCEYSGSAASPADASNSSTIVGSSGNTTNAAPVSTTQTGDLVIAVAALHSGINAPSAPSWSDGFTNELGPVSSGTGTSAHVHTFYGELVAGAADSYSTVCTWTTAFSDRQHLIIAFKEAGIVVVDAGGFRQHSQHPGRRPMRAAPRMWQLDLTTEVPTVAVPEVELTPVDVPVDAVALAVEPLPVELTLTPCVATLSAVSITATPGVTLTPATLTLTAVAVAAAPVVTLTPASLTLSPVAVTAVPLPPTVALTPRTVAVTAVAVTPVPQPVTVALTPRTVSLTPVAVTPVPQPVTVALVPAISTLSAVALGLGGVGAVSLTSAVAAVSAVALTVTPGAVTVALTPVTVTLTARPLSPAPVAPTVALTPASLALTGQPLGVTAPGLVTLSPVVLVLAGNPIVAATPGTVTLTPAPLVFAVVPLGLVIAVEPGDPVIISPPATATVATVVLPIEVATPPDTVDIATPATTARVTGSGPTAGVT